MSGKKLFGTDGVRGVANRELTVELAVRLGRAAVCYYRAKTGLDRPLFFIGRDPRISSGMLDGAVTAGICSVGGDVQRGGVLPTPAVAYLTRTYGCTAGVVISASHNPVEDNGIKFFDGSGQKLSDAEEREIEKIVLQEDYPFPEITGTAVGDCLYIDTATEDYYAYVRSIFAGEKQLAGLKIVVDGAHGAASMITPALLMELGAEVTAINCQPDGVNINAACGSLHLDALGAAVVAAGAEIGIAHDGDADRVLFVDERGQPVNGDYLMALCAVAMRQRGELPGNAVVATVMSNLGFENFLKEKGIRVLRTPVGDRYVLEGMLKNGYKLGGEQSGHIIFYDLNHTGDGIITALQVLSIFKQLPGTFAETIDLYRPYPQKLQNVRVRSRVPFADVPGLLEKQAELETAMGGSGRIVLRYSGTEPLARVMVEAEAQGTVDDAVQALVEIIEKEIGE